MTKAKGTSNQRARKTHNSICQTGYDEQQYSKTKNLFFRRNSKKEKTFAEILTKSLHICTWLTKIRCRKHLFNFPRSSAFLSRLERSIYDVRSVMTMKFSQNFISYKSMIEERYKAFEKKILGLYKSKLRLIYMFEIGQQNEVVGSCEKWFFFIVRLLSVTQQKWKKFLKKVKCAKAKGQTLNRCCDFGEI